MAKHAAMTKVGSGAMVNALKGIGKFLGQTAANVAAWMGIGYGAEWLMNKLFSGQGGQAANQEQAQQLHYLLAGLANAANAGQQMLNQQYFAQGHIPEQYIAHGQLPGQYVVPQYTYVPYMPQHFIGTQPPAVPGMLDYNYITQLARTDPGQLAALAMRMNQESIASLRDQIQHGAIEHVRRLRPTPSDQSFVIY
jgi:hypothetical protein